MNYEPEYVERLEKALQSIRKAAGSCQHFTNRLQFIYERAGVALANEEWNEEWRSSYGYSKRHDIRAENDRLRAELETLRSAPSAPAVSAEILERRINHGE